MIYVVLAMAMIALYKPSKRGLEEMLLDLLKIIMKPLKAVRKVCGRKRLRRKK